MMRFKPGDVLEGGGESYKLEQVLWGNCMPEDHFSHYREEWLASIMRDSGRRDDKQVVITVFCPEMFAKVMKVSDPYTETRLVPNLHTESFLRFRGTEHYTKVIGEGTCVHWLVNDYVTMETFESFVARGDKLSKKEKWGHIWDILVGLKEIRQAMPKACHFNLNPNTIYVHTDDKGQHHAIIRGLNFVAVPSETSTEIDKSQLRPDFLPPETPVRPFTAAAMQFNMALLIAWFLSGGRHPWKLTKVMPRYDAYKAMRTSKPSCKVSQTLEPVLQKALLINPEYRYPSFDAFAMAALGASGLTLSKKYSCFGNGKSTEEKKAEKPLQSPVESAEEKSSGGLFFKSDNKRAQDPITGNPILQVDFSHKRGKGFAAVAGMTTLKDDLRRDFIDVVNNLKLAREYGIRVPSLMLYGPPGTGKTYIATRLAEELGIAFTMVTPSDLASVYIHGTQSLISQLFESAAKKAKSNKKGVLMVFDEMDAICPRRSSDNEHQAGEVAEMLTQLNNCAERGIYVIGTTNRIDMVDRAVLRKGRLDKTIYVGLPDAEARKDMFSYELSHRPHAVKLDMAKLVAMTDGFTSSDISHVVVESARRSFSKAVRGKADAVVKIDQRTLEEVIGSMSSSVTPADMRHYERMREEFSCEGQRKRPSIGFAM